MFVCSFILLQADEQRIVLHGHASHFEKTDRLGNKFNEKNYGIGYEYNTYDGIDNKYFIEPVLTFSVNVIKDSYKNLFPFAGIGLGLRTKGYYGIGIDISGFVGYKKINSIILDNNNKGTLIDSSYTIMGGVTPGVKLYIGDFSLNYNYSPHFEGFGMYIEGFHYFSLSYKFI